MASAIPSFYRLWFTTIDPVFTLLGIAANLFTPGAILKSYTPYFVYPPTTETTVLLDTTAGFFAGLLVLQVFLLRARANDMTVWRAVQASTLAVDFGMLGAIARGLRSENRTDWRGWRAEEWVNLGIAAWVAVLRVAFLLGVGVGGQRGGAKKRN